MSKLASHLPLNRQRTPCAEKNDALGWTDGRAFGWSGVSVGLRCNRAEMLPLLEALLPADAKRAPEREVDILLSVLQGGDAGRGRKNYHIVYDGWNRVARTLDWAEALAAFQEALRSALALQAREHTLLDCFLAEVPGTRVMVCPATVRPQSWVDVSPGRESPQVVFVVDDTLTHFSEPLSAGQAALELVRFTPASRTQPQRVLAEAAKLAQQVRMYRAPAQQTAEQYDAFLRGQ